MSSPLDTDIDARNNRRRTVTGVIVIFGGLAILAATALVALSWRSQLPDPVASHWGVGGAPDGFSSLTGLLAGVLGIGAGVVVLFGVVTWALGQSSVNRRIGAAATAWVSVFMAVIVVGTLDAQRGLADAREAGPVGGTLIVAVAASVVSAVLAALAVPGDLRRPTSEAVATDAPRVKLVDGERASWIGRTTSAAGFYIALPVIAVTVVIAIWTRQWGLLGVDVVLIGVLATLSSFVVRVDRSGLTVRSAIGWPRYRVPLDEAVRADVTQVSPLKDFGGWGWRVGRDGRVGVVLRKGEALLVQRTGGRSIVVTVDGAASAAGLLNALADRARS